MHKILRWAHLNVDYITQYIAVASGGAMLMRDSGWGSILLLAALGAWCLSNKMRELERRKTTIVITLGPRDVLMMVATLGCVCAVALLLTTP